MAKRYRRVLINFLPAQLDKLAEWYPSSADGDRSAVVRAIVAKHLADLERTKDANSRA